MRIAAVKGWDVLDESREFRLCRSYGADIGEAVEVEHRCNCPSCDICKAADAGFATVAADLLAGATETPLLEAVERAHRFNGTAEAGEMYESDEWREWFQHWQDAQDRGRLWQCLRCDAWTWDAEHCGCCGTRRRLARLECSSERNGTQSTRKEATGAIWFALEA